MASGGEEQYATPRCEDGKDFGDKSEMTEAQDEDKGNQRKKGSHFSSSASAHDLRNHDLEKEKDDISSPRGVLEACTKESDSDDVSQEKNSKAQNACKKPGALFRWGKLLKLWKKKSFQRLGSFPQCVPKLPKWKSPSTTESSFMSDLYNSKSSMVTFSLSDLRTATDNFNNENLIGKGGFSEVYQGCLPDGQLLAVKRLIKGTSDERTAEFLSEIGVIAYLDHPNTAKLLGYGVEGGLHLVFKLSPLGSLGRVLHGSNRNKLDWGKRYKITLGTAEGLLYLHENCHKRIIHRDIKANNVLLTEKFEPEICDFGLAKWLPEKWTHHNVSKFEGTFGYFAPEYIMHGVVDEKIDVYSFGILLLEIVSGRPALDDSQLSIMQWAKPLLDNNKIDELVDPSLGGNYDSKELDRVVLTASLCVEQSSILRPMMNEVVVLLRGDENILESRRFQRRTYSHELLDAQEYNSTRCSSDINRLKEIALS